MAVYGRWQDCAEQVAGRPGFAEAFAFVAELMAGRQEAARLLAALPPGESRRIELDGDRLFAMLQHSSTRPRAEQQLESHRRYADVQVVVDGDELMELAPLEGLRVTAPYDASRELTFYAMPAESSRLIMRAGDCAVLFPSDAHAPLQAPGDRAGYSRRVVVKVQL
jgi:YhcH/YjgK/YiaL family protein